MHRRLKVAVLCHFPPIWFERYGVNFHAASVQGELSNGAFSTVEGSLIEALANEDAVDLEVITFSKGVRRSQTVSLTPHARLHVLRPLFASGMPVAWMPRYLKVRALLRELQPDLVHGIRNIEGYGYFAAFSGFPNVVTPQEFLRNIPRPAYLEIPFQIAQVLESLTLRRTRYVVAISRCVQQWVEKRSSAEIFIIPNSAAAVFFNVEKEQNPEGVLFVGRISPEKGLMDLLQALEIAAGRGVIIPAKIVGGASGVSDRHWRECQSFAREHLRPGQADFLGWQGTEAIANLHAKCAVFAMPSLAPYETMGVVLAESLAAGTPAVVYDFGPMPTVILHGKTGLVVPAGDIIAFSNALIELITDGARRNTFSTNARAASKVYRGSNLAKKHLDVYSGIAMKAGDRRSSSRSKGPA